MTAAPGDFRRESISEIATHGSEDSAGYAFRLRRTPKTPRALQGIFENCFCSLTSEGGPCKLLPHTALRIPQGMPLDADTECGDMGCALRLRYWDSPSGLFFPVAGLGSACALYHLPLELCYMRQMILRVGTKCTWAPGAYDMSAWCQADTQGSRGG